MASTAEADDRPESQVVEYHSLRELAFPLYLPTLLAHATRSVTLTVLPLHIFATGFSYDDVGLLSTIYGLGAAFGNIPAGAWATLHGPRSTLFVSCWLFGLSAASASLVGVSGKLRFPCFCFAFLLLGIAETVGIFARQLFMGSTTRGALTDHASSTQGGVARIATTFAPLIGGVVAETWSPTAVYKLQGVFAVLCAASTYAYVPHISSTQDLGKPNAKVKECRPNQQGARTSFLLGGTCARYVSGRGWPDCCVIVSHRSRTLPCGWHHDVHIGQDMYWRCFFLVDGSLLGRVKQWVIRWLLGFRSSRWNIEWDLVWADIIVWGTASSGQLSK
mmetsp:Transcript_98391/g.317329  ORF Transcript_98391/g.317329 Transcript_98391/m.317329 type:complete len:333 (+) Transcript_98391:54-1052(+)